jgi:hypothetical protein
MSHLLYEPFHLHRHGHPVHPLQEVDLHGDLQGEPVFGEEEALLVLIRERDLVQLGLIGPPASKGVRQR